MALKNFTQFTPQTLLSATDYVVGYRDLDEIRTDLDSLTNAISGLLIIKGFTPGGSVGSVRKVNYRYTVNSNSPVNAVSGVDDFGLTLSYTPGQVEVYRNGSHLVESLDFLATNNTQILNLSTLNLGDIVEVVALSATGVNVIQTLTGAGVIVQANYRYTVPTSLSNGAVTVTGPDDFGSTLRYAAPNLAVYLNGSHLVNSYDYTATNGTSITLNEPVVTGDVVDVQTLSSAGTGAVYGLSAFAGVSRLTAQAGVKGNATSGVITVSADVIGLDTKTSPAANDQVMIFDVAGNTNKKTTVSALTALVTTPPSTTSSANWQLSSVSLTNLFVNTGAPITGVPSWAKKMTVTLYDASFTGGPGSYELQLGSGAGPTYKTSGYDSRAAGTIGGTEPSGNEVKYATSTAGLMLTDDTAVATSNIYGNWTAVKVSGNIWVLNGSAENGATIDYTVGSVDLAATLTAVRLVTNGSFGANAIFDSGTMSIIFEG